MLYTGGQVGGVALALLGLSAVALFTLLVTIASAERPPRGWMSKSSFNMALGFVYIPAIIWALNGVFELSKLPQGWAYIVLVLIVANSLLLHFYIQSRSNNQGQITSIMPPASAAPALPKHKGAMLAEVVINDSVRRYKDSILEAESGIQMMNNIQWRIAPYFKTDEIIRYIARQRFGDGSPNIEAYLAEHQGRRARFAALLASNAPVREIYSLPRLLQYVRTGTHAENKWPLTPDMVRGLLNAWINALNTHENYVVGITALSLPIKYHILNDDRVVIHEPVGEGESFRLNSIILYGHDTAAPFLADFERVWSEIPPEFRNRQSVTSWIEGELIPQADRKTEIRNWERNR